MLVATTSQVHDIIVWRGHDYQFGRCARRGPVRDLFFAVAELILG
jgi:hypothetical protein